MALTAFPTIVFNSSTGSDSLASGAGPATAITGTCAASTNSTTVTFNGNPDLSGVAQDGSAVLWLNGIGFVRISTVDDTANTCVVETALTIGDGTSFAIGGKRATLDETESRRLFAATATPTASGASGGWTVTLEGDQSLTSAITLAFTAGSGHLRIQSDDATLRTITQTANAALFLATTANKFWFKSIGFRHSNATKSYVFVSSSNASAAVIESCVCGAADGTNCPSGLWSRTNSTATLTLLNSSVQRCTVHGLNLGGGVTLFVLGSDVSRNAQHGIFQPANLYASASIIAHNGADGINGVTTFTKIDNCTIDGNAGDGIEVATNNAALPVIVGNQITNNGAYGVNFSGTTPHSPIVQYNNFYGNTTNPANGITLDATNLTVDPGYTDRTNSVRNYAVGTAMKAAGFPASTATIGAGQSGTTTYIDIGAAQRQEAGSTVIVIDD